MGTEKKIPIALLVEDSEDDAYFFRRTLQKSGSTCSVHHVSNGTDAITFLRQATRLGAHRLPHIIFLDLKMPMLNGFEVLTWMREEPLLSKIPVVVLSGSEHQDDKDRASQHGAADYLVKPLKVADIRRLLSQICPADDNRPAEKMGARA